MAMHAAPRAPRRRSPKPACPTTAVLVLVLVVLALVGQCGSQAETSDSVPTITVTVPSTTRPAPPVEAPQPAGNETANGGPVYYKNCAAARAAGVTPLYAGYPGYSSKLDRDGDGVACE